MLKRIIFFFHERDPDLGFFCQAFAMVLANIFGLLIWLIRFPCSSIIVAAPGIIAAIIFSDFSYKNMFKQSMLSSFLTALFCVFIIMLTKFPGFILIFTFCFVYYLFASPKTRYVVSFSIVPCALAYNMPPGALSAVDRAVESFLSGLIAFLTTIFIKELFYKRRVKYSLLTFIEKIESVAQNGVKNYEVSGINSFKSINLIKRNVPFFCWNKKTSEKYKDLMYKLIEMSRAVFLLKQFKLENNNLQLSGITEQLKTLKKCINKESFDFQTDTQLKVK